MKNECYLEINPDEVKIKGDSDEVLALYGTLTHELLDCGIDVRDLRMAFELGTTNNEKEMDKVATKISKERISESKEKLLETFKKLLFGEE